MSPQCSTKVKHLRIKLVEEIAQKAKQFSDEDYKKFMNYLKEGNANDEEKNKLNDKKLNDDEDT